MKPILTFATWTLIASSAAMAAGPYTSKIEKIQAATDTSDYRTVHLISNITGSGCTDTDTNDRIQLVSDVQVSTVLLAMSLDSEIEVWTNGCNAADIAKASTIYLTAP